MTVCLSLFGCADKQMAALMRNAVWTKTAEKLFHRRKHNKMLIHASTEESRATCRNCDGDDCRNNILEDIIREGVLTSGYFSVLPISTKPAGKWFIKPLMSQNYTVSIITKHVEESSHKHTDMFLRAELYFFFLIIFWPPQIYFVSLLRESKLLSRTWSNSTTSSCKSYYAICSDASGVTVECHIILYIGHRNETSGFTLIL